MRIEDIAVPMSREEHEARMEAIRRKGQRSREMIKKMIDEAQEKTEEGSL